MDVLIESIGIYKRVHSMLWLVRGYTTVQQMSYWIPANSPSFLNNLQYALSAVPVNCDSGRTTCESYLLPASLGTMSSNLRGIDINPLVIVYNAPASQVEFRAGVANDIFSSPASCFVFGDQESIDVKVCLSESDNFKGSIDAGTIVCPQWISGDGEWESPGQPYNVSTTASIFKSMLAFVFWEFSMNNWGNPDMANATQGPDGVVTFLPPEYHTTASTANPLTRLVIDWTMFILYVIFQSITILFCWTIMLWRLIAHLPRPEIFSFPLMDLVFKSNFTGKPILDADKIVNGSEGDFIRSLKRVKIVARRDHRETKSAKSGAVIDGGS
ncbi:hypothetical protein K469DRAFT_692518 [Zopfia rhizophila CBS 207.26]|uniref:Uncharacterized protein n=1 Tax=Zopfia rhizophila CBS 207.26 TaxID=1314779 RepID=A0A6A6DN77_9PEZI|nr:hypothetical protein K469DRAFT_692518 [Zopfia rhizophila CBS 207.26]